MQERASFCLRPDALIAVMHVFSCVTIDPLDILRSDILLSKPIIACSTRVFYTRALMRRRLVSYSFARQVCSQLNGRIAQDINISTEMGREIKNLMSQPNIVIYSSVLGWYRQSFTCFFFQPGTATCTFITLRAYHISFKNFYEQTNRFLIIIYI